MFGSNNNTNQQQQAYTSQQTQANNASTFGGTNINNQQQQQVFTNQQNQASNANVFGGTNINNQQNNSSIFAQNQAVSGKNGFVLGQAGQSATNINNSVQNQSNLFNQTASTFGGSQNTTPQNPNGGTSLFGSAPASSASLFGSTPAHGASLFGSAPVHGAHAFGYSHPASGIFSSSNIFGVNPNDLHVFQMYPSEQELSKLKEQQLTNIKNLKIWNNYGQIYFLEPVSIEDVNFQEILIMPNKIEVLTQNLIKKKRQYLYHHYLNYMFLSQKKKEVIRRAIQLQLKHKGMKFISLSEVNGDLLVQLE